MQVDDQDISMKQQTPEHKNDSQIQVEYNKYIWVYEDPATDTFSSPSAILFGKQKNQKKRLRSFSAPQDIGTDRNQQQIISKHVVKRRRIASITSSCGEVDNENSDCSSSPSKMDIDFLVD